MKKLLLLSCALSLLGCSKTRDLHKLKPTSQIALPHKQKVQRNSGDVERIIYAQQEGVKQKSQVLHGEMTAEGDIQGNIELGEIQVVARSKRVPERAGKVMIEFVVSIPKTLLRKDWQLALFPKLVSDDSISILRPMVMNGNEFRDKQDKQYKQYSNYLSTVETEVNEKKDRFLNKKKYNAYLARKDYFRAQKNEQIKREYSAHLFFNHILQERKVQSGMPHNITQSSYNRNAPISWFALIPYAKERREKLLNRAMLTGRGPELEQSLTKRDSLHAYSLFWDKRAYDSNKKKVEKLDETYERIVEYPIYENAYMDTIVTSGKQEFTYVHLVDASESSPKMYLALDGAVTATDGSTYEFNAKDTLTYFVSSMTNFIDRTPRFKRKINLRAVQAELSVNLLFPAGKTEVVDSLAANAKELEKLKAIYTDLVTNKELVVDSIVIKAGSSPEGAFRFNDILSQQRALKVSEFITNYFSEYPELKDVSRPYSISENWGQLERLLRVDTLLPVSDREGIINIMQREKDPDVREQMIKNKYSGSYQYMKEVYYPQLRSISFMFHLHRSGFVKDTVYTNEPDIEYAKGIDLLDKKKYREALDILREYDDANTALAHMSLGHDQQALISFAKQTPTPDIDYMLAILYLRTEKEEEALRCYQRACEADPSKVFRGNLDPEIQKLKMLFNIE